MIETKECAIINESSLNSIVGFWIAVISVIGSGVKLWLAISNSIYTDSSQISTIPVIAIFFGLSVWYMIFQVKKMLLSQEDQDRIVINHDGIQINEKRFLWNEISEEHCLTMPFTTAIMQNQRLLCFNYNGQHMEFDIGHMNVDDYDMNRIMKLYRSKWNELKESSDNGEAW